MSDRVTTITSKHPGRLQAVINAGSVHGYIAGDNRDRHPRWSVPWNYDCGAAARPFRASSPEQFAAIIKSEIAKMGKVIKDADLKSN